LVYGTMSLAIQVASVLGLLTGQALGVNNGLARTPQMGWVHQVYLPVWQYN